MVEAAITLPVVVFLTLAMLNLSMAWYAAIAASNAANYGARIGSVTQDDPGFSATNAAYSRLAGTGIGTYTVSATGGGGRGSQVVVSVDWAVPNYMGSMLSFFGGTDPVNFHGTALSTFRQEGW